MKNKSNITAYLAFSFMLLASLVMVFVVNLNSSFMMDDLWYSTKLFSEEPISSVKDIIAAQFWHYNNWGGRTMAHTLLQFILLWGKRPAEILNTLAVLLSAVIIMGISETISGVKYELKNKIGIVALLIGAIHGLNANWRMSMYWESGAANYLYITIFILLFLWCYIRKICKESEKNLPGICIWIIPLALIAGWSNENMGPVAFLFAVATIVYAKLQKRDIDVWMIEGAAASLMGVLFCLLSPGNAVRGDEIVSKDYGIVWQLYLRCYSVANGLFNYLIIPTVLVIVLVIIAKGVLNIKFNISIYFLLVATLLSWGAMVLSPHYPDRASYGTMILLIVSGLTVINLIINEKSSTKPYLFTLGAVIWLRGMFFLAEFLGIMWGWIR